MPPTFRCSPTSLSYSWPASTCRRRWSPASKTSLGSWASAMALLDNITHHETIKRHRPWPRAAVTDPGWQQAIDLLADGRCTLLGLWGDAPDVHMALLDGTSDVAVISYTCKSGKYPSVEARHPPAIRLERAIGDLSGLEALGTPDARPWLDLGFWSVRHPLGKKAAARKPVPYKFLPAIGE